MRSDLFLRGLLILTDLIVIVGDLVYVESLPHTLSSGHSTLIVRHRILTYMEARRLHGWVHASTRPLWHHLFLNRRKLTSILVLVQLILLHVP